MKEDEILQWTPETLRSLAKQIEDMRMSTLLNVEDAGADPESEQYFLLALSAMDTAFRFMTLAVYKQSQGIAHV